MNAFDAAKKQSPPNRAKGLSLDFQHLASLCRDLQRRAGMEPFFLDGRAAAKVLGQPYETVASWLRGLRHIKIITLAEQGKRRRAPRHRYIARD